MIGKIYNNPISESILKVVAQEKLGGISRYKVQVIMLSELIESSDRFTSAIISMFRGRIGDTFYIEKIPEFWIEI